jgi:hypothetical protein
MPQTELPVDNMPQALDFYLRQGYEATAVDDGYAFLRGADDETSVTLRSRRPNRILPPQRHFREIPRENADDDSSG